MSEIITQARALLQTSQPEKALELLLSQIDTNKESVPYLSLLGQTYLENNQVQEAYKYSLLHVLLIQKQRKEKRIFMFRTNYWR